MLSPVLIKWFLLLSLEWFRIVIFIYSYLNNIFKNCEIMAAALSLCLVDMSNISKTNGEEASNRCLISINCLIEIKMCCPLRSVDFYKC